MSKILDLTEVKLEQLQLIRPLDPKVEAITITWNTGKRCNYACSYCWKDLHDKTSPHRSFDELVQAWLRLRQVIGNSRQPARIIFTGGEPTLNPDFMRFVEFLDRTQRRWLSQLSMTSNGSESFEYYSRLLRHLDGISFSTHFEWWDEKTFMTMVLDLWRLLGKNSKGRWIHINAMYENWEAAAVQKVHNILKVEGIPQTPYKIINFYGSKGIANPKSIPFDYRDYLISRNEPAPERLHAASPGPSDLTEILAEESKAPDNVDIEIGLADGSFGLSNSVQLMNFGLSNFPGWMCHVEKSLYIHNDGVISAGNCRIKELGNVYDAFTPLSGPVVCDGRLCVCTIDIQLEKHRPSAARDLSVAPAMRRDAFDKVPKSPASP